MFRVPVYTNIYRGVVFFKNVQYFVELWRLDKCVPTYLNKDADGACHLSTSELDIKSRQVSGIEC